MMKDAAFKLLRGFADRLTDEQTNRRTLVIVELLSRLKIITIITINIDVDI